MDATPSTIAGQSAQYDRRGSSRDDQADFRRPRVELPGWVPWLMGALFSAGVAYGTAKAQLDSKADKSQVERVLDVVCEIKPTARACN